MCQLCQQLLWVDAGTACGSRAGGQHLEAPSGRGTAGRETGGQGIQRSCEGPGWRAGRAGALGATTSWRIAVVATSAHRPSGLPATSIPSMPELGQETFLCAAWGRQKGQTHHSPPLQAELGRELPGRVSGATAGARRTQGS